MSQFGVVLTKSPGGSSASRAVGTDATSRRLTLAVLAFTVLANAIYNRFWTAPDPMRRHFTEMLFWANTAVMGGLLLVLENLP